MMMNNGKTGIVKCECDLCNRNSFIAPNFGRVYENPVSEIQLAKRYLQIYQKAMPKPVLNQEQAKMLAKTILVVYRELGYLNKTSEINTCLPIRLMIHYQILEKMQVHQLLEYPTHQFKATLRWGYGFEPILEKKPQTLLDKMCQALKRKMTEDEKQKCNEVWPRASFNDEILDWRW